MRPAERASRRNICSNPHPPSSPLSSNAFPFQLPPKVSLTDAALRRKLGSSCQSDTTLPSAEGKSEPDKNSVCYPVCVERPLRSSRLCSCVFCALMCRTKHSQIQASAPKSYSLMLSPLLLVFRTSFSLPGPIVGPAWKV